MKVVITQLRIRQGNPDLPEFLHNTYTEDNLGEMLTARPGYEIAAVYLMPDNTMTGPTRRSDEIAETTVIP
jgi:hypothetical protein